MFHCGNLNERANVLSHSETLSESLSFGVRVNPSPQSSPQGEEAWREDCQAEFISASLAERIGKFPSPREEGVGERVQLEEKINPSLKIVPFRKMLKDNFSLSLGESSGCPVKHLGYLKKCAFTLAEVLITLGIIGVVAAITLPNLMTAYKARVLRSQFMKSYSLVQQAYKMMQADEVSTSPSDYDRSNEEDASFKTVFQRYFTGTTDCGLNGANKEVPCLKGPSPTYKLLLGDSFVPITLFDDGEFVLKDGTLLIFENPSGASFIRVWIFVDINGISRRPNRLGYDLFTFQLTDEGLKAMGDNGTEYIGDNYCSFSTTGSFNGITCANKAKNDPDYFKKVVKAIK